MYDVFVISPYTHDDAAIVAARVATAEEFLVNLTIEGIVAYSTIAAMHHLTNKFTLPSNYAFWRNHCRTMISCATEVYVLCLDGWEESQGVIDEIAIATELHKDIKYIKGNKMHYDSTGKIVTVGNRVRFRGEEYTIKRFLDSTGTCGTSQIEFEEEQHTTEVADEISIDLLT